MREQSSPRGAVTAFAHVSHEPPSACGPVRSRQPLPELFFAATAVSVRRIIRIHPRPTRQRKRGVFFFEMRTVFSLLAASLIVSTRADYMLYSAFPSASSGCAGAAYQLQASNAGGCAASGGGLFSRLQCVNGTRGLIQRFTSSTCSGTPTQQLPYDGYTCKTEGGGLLSNSACPAPFPSPRAPWCSLRTPRRPSAARAAGRPQRSPALPLFGPHRAVAAGSPLRGPRA